MIKILVFSKQLMQSLTTANSSNFDLIKNEQLKTGKSQILESKSIVEDIELMKFIANAIDSDVKSILYKLIMEMKLYKAIVQNWCSYCLELI